MKKFFIFFLLCCLFLLPNMVKAQTTAFEDLQPGDLIKVAGNPSVYYYANDGRRYVFPNDTTYFTWFNDFSQVKTIALEDLWKIMIGGNVVIRPGTKLVKITTAPTVYYVESAGVLRPLPSEQVAEHFFGPNWAQLVTDVPDAFFTNYSVAEPYDDPYAYPEGMIITESGSTAKYLVWYNETHDLQLREFADDNAFENNNYNEDYLVITDISYFLEMGDLITGSDYDLVSAAQERKRSKCAGDCSP